MTAAKRLAEEAFKQTLATKPPSEAEIAKTAFDENRQRLKILRLARDESKKINNPSS